MFCAVSHLRDGFFVPGMWGGMVGRGISRRAWGSPSLGERCALAWRKVTFCTAKGMVSQGKRYGFAEWLLNGCQLSVRQWVALCVLSGFAPLTAALARCVFGARQCFGGRRKMLCRTVAKEGWRVAEKISIVFCAFAFCFSTIARVAKTFARQCGKSGLWV